jgi:hypothetical protein
VALLDDFGLLQPYADDDCREAVYTLCLPVDDGVHCCISQSHTRQVQLLGEIFESRQKDFLGQIIHNYVHKTTSHLSPGLNTLHQCQ